MTVIFKSGNGVKWHNAAVVFAPPPVEVDVSAFIDAGIQDARAVATLLDVALGAADKGNDISINALLKSTAEGGDISLDAAIREIKSALTSLDVACRDTRNAAIYTDTLVERSGVGDASAIDAALEDVVVSLSALDGAIAATLSASLGMDALRLDTVTALTGMDGALMQYQKSVFMEVDAQLKKIGAHSCLGLNALLQSVREKTASLDSMIQKGRGELADIDSALQSVDVTGSVLINGMLLRDGLNAASVLSGLLQEIVSDTLAVDAALYCIVTETTVLEAAIEKKGITTALTLETILARIEQNACGIDAFVAPVGGFVILPHGTVTALPRGKGVQTSGRQTGVAASPRGREAAAPGRLASLN